MLFEIFGTTAEDVIGATDATLQINIGVTDNLVADFLDIPADNARNALRMAQQLGLITTNSAGNYIPLFPYATYLISGNLHHRAAILRFVLEQYQPYKSFKYRLDITTSANEAVRQVKALFSLNAHRGDILSTLVSLGTYTNSLIAEGAGRYRIPDSGTTNYLSIVEDIVHDREAAELNVRRKLGEDAVNWIDHQEVLNPLITAYQKAAVAHHDPRAPIVYAGNAIESFLVQVANHF